jgi:hypothetical protein
MDANLSKQLAYIIDKGTRNNPLPMRKGNSIRVGKVAIRFSIKKGYILFDCVDSEQICLAHSKVGALAIAKLYNAEKDIGTAQDYDKTYEKHDNDCIFYEYSIKNASDIFKKDLADVRLGVAVANRDKAYRFLEAIIFD